MGSGPMEFQKLVDKMRRATPSRLLDCEVHLIAQGDVPYGRTFFGKRIFLSGYVESFRDVIDEDDAIPDEVVPRYTSTFEAAYGLLRQSDVTMLSLEGDWEPATPEAHPAWAVRYYTRERPPSHEKGGWYGAIAAGTAPAIALCRVALVVLARSKHGQWIRAE